MSGTGVDVTIGGQPFWSTGAYSIVEDSTPVDPSDMTGGTGQISFTVRDKPGIKLLGGKALEFTDGAQGKTSGIVRGLNGTGLAATITADSRLALTAVTRKAAPFVGTLGGALRYYLGLCGITSGIVIDETLENVPVKLPGWDAVVYDKLKQLGPARGFEFTLASSNIVFRPFRGRIAENYRDAGVTWTLDESNLAQRVEGYVYNTTSGTKLAYPPGGWTPDVQNADGVTVDAGATVVLDLDLDASLSSVEQPVCVEFVDRTHEATSVYSVSGNDGIAIPPAQWAAGGGSVTVAIGEDTRSLKVTIKASTETEYAPYRIAVSAGTSDYYSSLRIRGTGVFYRRELHTLVACTDTDRAPQEVGVTIDNEAFETWDQLYHALLWASTRFGTPRQTITVRSKGINRRGDTGSYVYPTIGDLKAMYPGATIGSLKATPGFDGTIGEWNATLFASVANDFENQAFGNVGGARVRYEDSWYRIRTATLTQGSINYTAERDNTVADVYRTGETIGQWKARWAGKTIKDVNIAPLQGLVD
ncbi:hypothetical protein [Microbacterium sp. zg-YB36]|uniref:hypothetical protein n=1 Tax=Microbacterium sp. zg-YB36 TaxID=2969407 RepID=UPI00214BB19C|nr:hypothetical protein [Microbacterium sp. zg-YB36]MDL5351105.1 hypothetical protein [Microbacterium sp. zg-YB36]